MNKQVLIMQQVGKILEQLGRFIDCVGPKYGVLDLQLTDKQSIEWDKLADAYYDLNNIINR